MKKIKYLIGLLVATLAITSCSCSNEGCECPTCEECTNKYQQNETLDLSQKYAETTTSVVLIKVIDKDNPTTIYSTGSGVVYLEEGTSAYILTNAHVVKDIGTSKNIEIFFSGSDGKLTGASETITKKEIMGLDYYEDVAVLKIPKSEKYTVAQIGDSSSLVKGQVVYAIGSPFGINNSFTSGYIITYNLETQIDNNSMGRKTAVYAIVTDATLNPGNSGGGLFDKDGKLIGITTFSYNKVMNVDTGTEETSSGLYGALPINYFLKVANYLLTNGTNYKRPTLNLYSLQSVKSMGSLKEALGISNLINEGIYVAASAETKLAGAGDNFIITKINGKEINTVEEYYMEILNHSVGENIILTIRDRLGLNANDIEIGLHE